MLAYSCGLDAVGVSRAEPVTEGRVQYLEWLARGYQGEMTYLERNFEKRFDPTQLVSGAQSIISTLLSYKLEGEGVWTEIPKISRYAVFRDYHFVLKERLFRLLSLLQKEVGEVHGRALVDSAPFLDRYWAMRAGLGWLGKQSLLISPRLGSFTFIGSLVVDIEIETSKNAVKNRCGNCHQCIDACPTGALLGNGLIDARKCIAYLTIEKKTHLTPEERNTLNGWAYGCDCCQDACPWNKRAPETRISDEIIITREHLDAFAKNNEPLPTNSPMNRANPERLRELLTSEK